MAQPLTNDAENPIPVEEDDHALDEVDSAFGDSSDASAYTASLASSVYNHVYENGRRYHSYREGSYLAPNDEEEQDRMDLQHHIWKMLQNGGLITAPIKDPATILDIGTGTGIWAIEVAEEYPGAMVTGTDISPIQPGWVPSNCHFYIDDAESDWTYQNQFDYVHGRSLGNAIGDWDKFCTQAFQTLKPGGWLEIQDFEGFVFSDDGTLRPDSWVSDWLQNMDIASAKFGKHYNYIAVMKDRLIKAGFVDIREQIMKVPIGVWAKSRKMKELGKFMEVMMCKAADSYTPAPYTRLLGYSMEQTQVVIEHVKQELQDRKIHTYGRYHFLSAQRPVS